MALGWDWYFMAGVVEETVTIMQGKLLEVLAVQKYFDTRESWVRTNTESSQLTSLAVTTGLAAAADRMFSTQTQHRPQDAPQLN